MTDTPLSAELAARYDLRLPIEPFAIGQGMNSQTVGVHTGSGDFLWKGHQSFHPEDSIRYEHRLLRWLAGRELSFAVAAPVPDQMGDTLCVTAEGLYALFPFLPGEPVDYAALGQLQNVGAGLAELQAGLADYPAMPHPQMAGFDDLAGLHPAIPNLYFPIT